jgi:hypothetical protein
MVMSLSTPPPAPAREFTEETLHEQDARRVIQDEIDSLGKSPPPRPMDPDILDRLPDNPLDQGIPY